MEGSKGPLSTLDRSMLVLNFVIDSLIVKDQCGYNELKEEA